jgi:hypothetical protein
MRAQAKVLKCIQIMLKEGSSKAKISEALNIDVSLISKWLKDADAINTKAADPKKKKLRSAGSGRKSLFEDISTDLYKMFRARRIAGDKVTCFFTQWPL